MPKVVVNGHVIADSDETVVVEGNHYFPPHSIDRQYFAESSAHTFCPWKGTASYYDIVVDGKRITDGAWYYPDPKRKARKIRDHVAFYRYKVDDISA